MEDEEILQVCGLRACVAGGGGAGHRRGGGGTAAAMVLAVVVIVVTAAAKEAAKEAKETEHLNPPEGLNYMFEGMCEVAWSQ